MKALHLTNNDIDSLLADFHQSFVVYPDVEKIFEGLDWIVRRSQFGKFTPSMLITGGTGAGKTSVVETYLNNHFSASEVLITRVRPSFVETLIWAIEKLNVSYNRRSKCSEIGLQDYFIDSVKKSGLKLLIIEEAQELFECASVKERQKIRDRLKMISDECRLPIVFVGIPTAKLILEDSQWDRRIMVKRELPYISITGEESLDVYIDLLEGIEQQLPISVQPELSDMEIAMRLLAASKGMLSLIKELVGYAFELALLEGKSQITKAEFIQAFKSIFGPDISNPFELELEKLSIPQVIKYESFLIDSDSGDIKFTHQIFEDIPLTELLR
ncbi:TniB family NTP-binding protein [Vibrio alginolyticus]|uniref:TniB family NTP-binding protein n=1 Tax=Vibrio TaxID=662 RepID=UPI001BD46200|nr:MULTISPECIES: TniB family NTP-binding protein [Vibrio]ELB2758296.1 TniB family NTP-binding protein [Vibrio alginolyticus]ELB2873963.1 TniB family NTP-binding protein [Vibrio alginolyticus]MBT0098317.1 TniB family NTP-binding protein [Vibrio alginolyticus]MCS0227040.1 TniB family NTP-binding protein [Vibrio alginolyticus]MDY8150398.1 TniB family NTP-binding protein [Vibrio sp. PBL-C16]